MKKRINKKIQKREGFKNWNKFYLHRVDEAIRAATRDVINRSSDVGTSDMIYAVVSRKIRKRKILKLVVLKNCYPVSSSCLPSDAQGDNEYTATWYCRNHLYERLVEEQKRREKASHDNELTGNPGYGSVYHQLISRLVEGSIIKHPPLDEKELEYQQTLETYLEEPAAPNIKATMIRSICTPLPDYPKPYIANVPCPLTTPGGIYPHE